VLAYFGGKNLNVELVRVCYVAMVCSLLLYLLHTFFLCDCISIIIINFNSKRYICACHFWRQKFVWKFKCGIGLGYVLLDGCSIGPSNFSTNWLFLCVNPNRVITIDWFYTKMWAILRGLLSSHRYVEFTFSYVRFPWIRNRHAQVT